MVSAFGQRNVGCSANVAVKKLACDFGELEPVGSTEETPGNPVDRKRLTEEDVVHPGRRIDHQFEVIVGRAKVNDAVYQNAWRLPKLIARDFFEELGLDPDDRVHGSQ